MTRFVRGAPSHASLADGGDSSGREHRRDWNHRPVALPALAAAILLMNGCGSGRAPVPTSYGPATAFVHFGYSETQIADDTFLVTFRGNTPTSLERATDFALLRAASVALDNECRHFAVVATNVVSVDEEAPTPPAPETSEEPQSDQLAGRDRTGRPMGDAATPTAFITISCVDDPAAEVAAYDARFVRENIASKYGLPAGRDGGE